MTKLTVALAAIVLVACYSEEQPDEAADTFQRPNAAGESSDPCPSTGANGETAGPKKTPSPVEHCEGAYECEVWSGGTNVVVKTYWFGFDGTRCTFGGNQIFSADGQIQLTSSDGSLTDRGHWEGDFATFRIEHTNGWTADCTRVPNQ